MLKRIPYGEWLPDQASTETLRSAKNVLPVGNNYGPFQDFASLTGPPPSSFLGGCAFVGLDGTSALLVGSATDLYRFSGTTFTSQISGSYPGWRFAQYGNLIIGATGGAPVKFDIGGGTAAVLGGSPPNASMVAGVRDFVFLAGDPSDINTVSWSGFNNAEQWTFGSNQSDQQTLPDGGAIMGLAGGEYGLVLQKRAIKRFSYVGGDVTFQVDEIASNIGCMARGSVAQAGRLVFFLSERGFYYTDGTDVFPIGEQKFNRWFFTRFSRQAIEDGITAAVDPRAAVVYWAMPGNPGTILAYNWLLKRGSYIEVPLLSVFSGFTANIDLDSIDALYPSGLDSIPVSLDSPQFAGGNPLFLAVRPNSDIGTFTGPNLAAEFITPRIELAAPRRARLRSIRPDDDAFGGSASIDVRARESDGPAISVSGSMRDNGELPVRANGRWAAITRTIPAATSWTYAAGVDVSFEPEGGR